jgi:hypothetical protein
MLARVGDYRFSRYDVYTQRGLESISSIFQIFQGREFGGAQLRAGAPLGE